MRYNSLRQATGCRNMILVFMLVLFSNHLMSQTDVEEASAEAGIVEAIQINQNQRLHFGDIMSGSYDVVRINLSGTNRIAVFGQAVLLPSDDGFPAIFSVTGTRNREVSITLPGDFEVFISNPGGQEMRIENFTSAPASTGTFDAVGELTVRVGAQLIVSTNQAVGYYQGTYDITIDYQ